MVHSLGTWLADRARGPGAGVCARVRVRAGVRVRVRQTVDEDQGRAFVSRFRWPGAREMHGCRSRERK